MLRAKSLRRDLALRLSYDSLNALRPLPTRFRNFECVSKAKK